MLLLGVYSELAENVKFLKPNKDHDRQWRIVKEAVAIISDCKDFDDGDLINVQALREYQWETLHCGKYCDVDPAEKMVYGIATYLEVVLIIKEYLLYNKEDLNLSKNTVVKCIEILDMGLLLGELILNDNNRDILAIGASSLSKYLAQMNLESSNIELDTELNMKDWFETEIPVLKDELDLTLFSDQYYNPGLPVLVKNALKNWPASTRWRDLKYFQKHFGFRTIPVEIGKQYTSEDWGQQLMPLSQFLFSQFVTPNKDNVMYLAQHDLFRQIPELKDDIKMPKVLRELNVTDPETKIWFGPGNTVSPLHYDKKENFLCQVLGWKRVILASCCETENLYPFSAEMMTNTSNVDLTKKIDEAEFPLIQKVQFKKVLLGPGDMLFIPYGWWHFVTSLTPSISVSFWWNK